MFSRISFISLVFCTSMLLANSVWAEEGITPDALIIGMSSAQSGGAAGLGLGMKVGAESYFKFINEKGGINGRKINLIVTDDKYEPDITIDNTIKLIEESKVFTLFGYVGTPTGQAALPIVTEKKVPLIGLFTGAAIFRQPVNRYVVNLRASYNDETEALVKHLTEDLGIKKIAVFYQDDSYGQAGLTGTEVALKKRGLTLAGKGTYQRNTVAVKTGLASIMPTIPEAVVMVGTYKPCAAFIKEAKTAGLNVVFANVSFVGTDNLMKEFNGSGEGVVVSQVVPFPKDESVQVVKEYAGLLKKYFPNEEPGYVSLEGFITAKLFALAAEKAGKDLTRDALLEAVESLKEFDLGGFKVTFGKDDHQGSDAIFMTQVKGGKIQPATKLTK